MILTTPPAHANPFPGLRPFDSNENHLFFGRDGQSDELLRRLRQKRFLAVVGTSGSGKSSLVRAGLLPALHGGFMIEAGSGWRVTMLRPGNDPIGNLAAALNESGVLDYGSADVAIQRPITEAALRRSALGLVEVARQARLPRNENLLIIVDQFEELFRFKESAGAERAEDDAAAFAKLLIEVIKQNEIPIYVVITMRSDFIGDCAQFRDLPEAINDSQYLIPRMTRDQRREAIAGPVAVGGAAITPRLMNHLLNDVGDDPDQLPILQHALMRTWQRWAEENDTSGPLDIRHYQDVGGMSDALSKHADKAYNELPDERSKVIAEKLFKLLTERGSDNREIRRPTKLEDICAVAEADLDAVRTVIDSFRRQGRSFLMPPAAVELHGETLIDISHESLIRGWQRLKTWVDEEARSARIYKRLAETAALHAEGKAGLWREPDLYIALSWREETRPNAAWGARYHPDFAATMAFLDKSRESREAEIKDTEQKRIRDHRRTQIFAAVLGLAFLISLALTIYAFRLRNDAMTSRENALTQAHIADRERRNAEDQRLLAEDAEAHAVNSEKQASADAERARRAEQQASVEADRARAAEQKALAEKRRAVDALHLAEVQRQLAEQTAQTAKEAELRATEAKRRADRLSLRVRKQNVDLSWLIILMADKLAQSSPQQEQAKWATIKSDAQARMGNRLLAVQPLTKLLKADGEDYEALLLRGYYNLMDSQPDKAADDARRALRLNQNSYRARENLILALGALGRYPEAAEQLREGIGSFIHTGYGENEEFAVSPDIKRATGQSLLYADSQDSLAAFNYEGAILAAATGSDDFEAALSNAVKAPQSKDAPLFALNWAMMNEQARSEDYGVLAAQGALWEEAGFKNEAVRAYSKFQCAYQDGPDQDRKRYASLSAWVGRRMSASRVGKVTCPVPELEPEKRDAHTLLLETYEAALGNKTNAGELFREAVETYPNDVDILLQRSQFRYNGSDFNGASHDADAVISQAPRTARAYVIRALANANLGAHLDDILKDVLEAKKLDPTVVPYGEDIFKGVYKISEQLEGSNLDEAINLLQRTARYNLPSATPYYELAKLQNRHGRYKEALENIDIAISMKAEDTALYGERERAENGLRRDGADVLFNKALGYQAAGDALHKLGRRGEASDAFEESLKYLDQSADEKNVEEVRWNAAATMAKVARLVEEDAVRDKKANPKEVAASYLEQVFGGLEKLKEVLGHQVDRLRREGGNPNPK